MPRSTGATANPLRNHILVPYPCNRAAGKGERSGAERAALPRGINGPAGGAAGPTCTR